MKIYEQYHKYAEENPKRIPETIRQLIAREKEFEKKYDYQEDLVNSIIAYIEYYVYIVDGENAGEKIQLTLTQKWIVNLIFGWYGDFEVEQYDANGKHIGTTTEYQRVTREMLIMVSSGFGKTTFVSALSFAMLTIPELYKDCKIFIGSNAHQQSKLCFNTTSKMLKKNPRFKNQFSFRNSVSEIEDMETGSLLRAMSSSMDNHEGIIPAVIILDEIHAMKTGDYANNLKKSVKRSDLIVFEITTQGQVRGGYLDDKLEYHRKILKGQTKNSDRICPVIFEQESVEEVIQAYHDNDIDVLFKSNPNIGIAQSPNSLLDKISEMLDDPSKKEVTLSKNFNIPQNPQSVFYSANECKTKLFNEELIKNKHIFVGLDMAYTSSPDNDLTALTFMFLDPNTEHRYHIDKTFLPKWYKNKDGEKIDMIKEKSKVDQIPYQQLIDKGDVVLVDETYDNNGEQLTDGCRITEQYIIAYIMQWLADNNCEIMAFGLDPSKASYIKSHFNQLANNNKFCVDYYSQKRQWTTPIILKNREMRRMGKVYCNSKLTEIHFANTIAKYDSNDLILFVNEARKRKDLVIAHMSCESAYDMWAYKRKVQVGEIEKMQVEVYKDFYKDINLTNYHENMI